MPPKRKAAGSIGNPPKRLASGAPTPQSMNSSDDEYLEEEDPLNKTADENFIPVMEAVNRLKEKFSGSAPDRALSLAEQRADPTFKFFGPNGNRDFKNLELKPDHADRPLWIEPDNNGIIIESFAPTFKQAENFLINIAEPLSRVSRIHEYAMTANSLYAAVSVGLTTKDIISRLEYFSKTPLHADVIQFILDSTSAYGKAKLVLKENKMYVESPDPVILAKLLKDNEIRQYRVDQNAELYKEAAPQMGGLYIPGTKTAAGVKQVAAQQKPQDDDSEDDEPVRQEELINNLLREDDDDDQVDEVHSFEVIAEKVKEVRLRCSQIGYPLTEEYDFQGDTINPTLDIDLKPAAQIRPYQEQALSKMFGNGRARSGIIVLPCGAGKTLVGITAACTVKKGCIVLCTSAMSVTQWRAEFLKWSNISPNDICVFTADQKDFFTGSTGIIISTYSMLSMNRKDKDGKDRTAHDTRKVIDKIHNRDWGLMILDEVHVVPAEMFQRVTYKIKTNTKLGLTATLLREDDKIGDLNFLIGPKLYEANWQELSEQGHIAKVQCAEVWCPMTSEFYQEYLESKYPNQKMLLFTMNPRKFQACQFLIDYHEKRGDKVIVFSDNVFALQAYARKLNKVFIFGGTPQAERQQILENFQHNPLVNTMFLSKIGDTSLDLPEATCLIQISSHYGSRRQEAQRLGRILRAKRRNDEGFNAFFYSLVSKDTQEMYYSTKRQAFLVDQGYAFKVITHLQGIENLKDLAFTTPRERQELLQAVLLEKDDPGMERIDDDAWGMKSKRGGAKGKGVGFRRTAGTLDDFSGGRGMMYAEQNKSRNKEVKKSSAIASMKKKEKKRKDEYKHIND
jgi:DNA excision repair protein ERCC-3